jgi:hypothetical protein
MQKQKNSESNNSLMKILVVSLVFVLLMSSGLLGAILELVFGLIFGAVGLVFGAIGLVLGLTFGLLGIVMGLLPLLIPVAIVAIVLQAISNRQTGDAPKRKRKNDFI